MKIILKFFNVLFYIGILILSIYLLDIKFIAQTYKNDFLVFIVWVLLFTSLVSVYNYFKFRINKHIKIFDKIADIIAFLFGCGMVSGIALFPVLLISMFITFILSLFVKSINIEQVGTIVVLLGLIMVANYYIYEEEIELIKQRKKIKNYKSIYGKYDIIVEKCNLLENEHSKMQMQINNMAQKINNI